MSQEIYIIDKNNNLILNLKQLFKNDYKFKFKFVEPKNIEILFKSIPELIIINEDNIDVDTKDLCKEIRNNKDNTITPILVISSNEAKEHKLDIIRNSVEYFVEKSMGEEYLKLIIRNISRLLSVNRTVSPLTGLPRKCKDTIRIKKEIIKKRNFFSTIF